MKTIKGINSNWLNTSVHHCILGTCHNEQSTSTHCGNRWFSCCLSWIKAVVSLSLNRCKSHLCWKSQRRVCDHQASTLCTCLAWHKSLIAGQNCSTSKEKSSSLLFPLGNVLGNPHLMVEWKSNVFQQGNIKLFINTASETCHVLWRTLMLWYLDTAYLSAPNLYFSVAGCEEVL